MNNRVCVLILSAGLMTGCGGEPNLTCDELQPYQQVGDYKRVEVPDGLDDLDPLREMPVPEASPRGSREAGLPCIDLPPGATSMQDARKEREAKEADADAQSDAENEDSSESI
ncbi:MAG: hypothetical protein AAF351_05110 [Pseudomonadota bacterium]